MRNAMRTIGRVSCFVFALVAAAGAQNRLQTQPSPAASGPAYDLSVGYTSFRMAMPGGGHANLGGPDVSGTIDLTPHWGATVDTSYVRTSSILGTPRGGSVMSFLGGPVFYPVSRGS